MEEIVKQCILSSESDITNDEESNYADKEDVPIHMYHQVSR